MTLKKIICLVVVLFVPIMKVAAGTKSEEIPEERRNDIAIYNTSLELPDPGNIYHKLLGTISNSSQYKITEIDMCLQLFRNEELVRTDETQVYMTVPSGETKDFVKNLILPYNIKDGEEDSHHVKIFVRTIRGYFQPKKDKK